MVVAVEVAVVHLRQAAAVLLPQMCLPWHAPFLNERPINGRLDWLCGHNRHPIELAETCDQSWKSQCSIGLFWVHWVSWRCDTYKLVNGIWMTLLLNNILPSNHNSDLPLPKCQLVYTILT